MQRKARAQRPGKDTCFRTWRRRLRTQSDRSERRSSKAARNLLMCIFPDARNPLTRKLLCCTKEIFQERLITQRLASLSSFLSCLAHVARIAWSTVRSRCPAFAAVSHSVADEASQSNVVDGRRVQITWVAPNVKAAGGPACPAISKNKICL